MTQRLMTRVRELRESLGLSQEAFAERAGLKYKHYQAVEAGRKSDFRFSTLEKLAKACGLEPWELLNFGVNTPAVAEDAAVYDSKKTPTKRPPKSSGRRAATKKP